MFPSLSSLSSPHPNAVDLTQDASMHNAAAAPQGQPNPTSETNVAQFATANRQAAQNSEFEGSEGDSLTDIFLKIKSEFPTLPSLSDPNGNEAQYQLSSDDLGFEGRSLALNPPSLEIPNSLRTSSNLLLVPHMPVPPTHLPVPPFLPVASNLPIPASVDSFAILPNAQTQQTGRRKRKTTHKAPDLYLPSSYIENDTNNGRPAKKVKGIDNEEPEEGDVNSQMDNIKKRINEFLEQENVSRVYFNIWLKDIIQLSQFEFTNNKNEYIKCIEDSFKSFLSGEIYRKRFTSSLFAYNSLKRINLLEEHILPILSSELKEDLSELIQGEKLKYFLVMRKRASIEAEGEVPNEILTNSKVDDEDNEEPQEGNASLQADNEAPLQDDDWKSKMDILKNRIRKFLESKKPNQHLFKSWLDCTIQLSKFEFKNNKNEYIKCIEDSFKCFFLEKNKKKFKGALRFKSRVIIKSIEKHILPILSPELNKNFNEFIQAINYSSQIDLTQQQDHVSEGDDNLNPKDFVEDEELSDVFQMKKTKSEANDNEAYGERRKISTEDITVTTNKALKILKTNFPQKNDFRSIMVVICNKPHDETKKKEYVDCINKIFKEFLSDKWKSRFVSALSLYYKQKKVNFLKEKIVPLLAPETGKILQEVVETYKPGGTTALRDAVKNFKFLLGTPSFPSSFESRSSFLISLLEVVVQYSKNLLGKTKAIRTSTYLTDISNIFGTLDDEKIQLLNAVLPNFSIEDLNILAEWIPEIKKPIDDEIARRALQAPQ